MSVVSPSGKVLTYGQEPIGETNVRMDEKRCDELTGVWRATVALGVVGGSWESNRLGDPTKLDLTPSPIPSDPESHQQQEPTGYGDMY